MAFSFPTSPTLNQQYTFGTKTWRFNGTGWVLVTGVDAAQSAWSTANLAYINSNTATVLALGAFNTANSKFDKAGGTISGNTFITKDLTVGGNLSVLGNTFSINAGSIQSNSTVLLLGIGNYATDALDIGFAGHYNAGTNAHTGLIRDSGTKEWYLFKNYVPEIVANNNIIISDPSFTVDTLHADLKGNTVLIKTIDILPYANSIYDLTNAAFNSANSGFLQANSAFIQANAVFNLANAAYGSQNTSGQYANSAFIQANSAYQSQNATGQYANSAFIKANASFDHANTAYQSQNATGQYANSAFITANSAGVYANGAFVTGNSAFIQANAAFNHANASYAAANNVFPQIQPAFNTANAAFIHANAAFLQANTPSYGANSAASYANSAFGTANSAASYANSAFTAANVADGKAVTSGNYANAAFSRANNSLDATTGGSVTGTVSVTGNVRANYIVANTGFASPAGASKLELTDIGLVAIDVASQQFKFGASGIESSPGIFGGTFGGNKLSLNNETKLGSYVYDTVTIETSAQGATNQFVFSNTSFTAPGQITATGFVAGGINVVPYTVASFNTANAAFNHANASYAAANNVFPQIQPAYNTANAAFLRANNSLNANAGGQITGDVTITGNLIVSGNTVYANAQTVLIADNILTLNAAINQSGAPTMNAGIEVDRGNQPNVFILWNETSQAWQFTNNGTTYENFGGGSSGVYANGAFVQANAAFNHANAAFNAANTGGGGGGGTVTFAANPPVTGNANGDIWIDSSDGTEYLYFKDQDGFQWVEFGPGSSNVISNTYITANISPPFAQANAAYNQGNSAFIQANAAFNTGNSGFIQANAAFNQANIALSTPSTTVNAAFNQANAAFNQANTANTVLIDSTRLAPNLKLNIIQVLESANIYSTAISGNVNIDIGVNTSYFFSSNTTGNVTFNLRGTSSASFDSTVATGQTASVAIALKQGATKYRANVYIDGVLQTPYWLGNSSPAYATSQQQSIDVYTYTVFKTAASTYSILAANSNFGLAQGQPGQG